MAFIQIIEYETNRADEVEALVKEMEASAPADSRVSRVTRGRDLDHEGRFFTIVEFASHEEAMKNSQDPRTQEFAARMMALGSGPPRFINLDVIGRFPA
jgi:quinol monooxygenase YgiN